MFSETSRRGHVNLLAHVDHERLAFVVLVRALGREGVLDLVARSRHVEPRAAAELNLRPIMVRQFIPSYHTYMHAYIHTSDAAKAPLQKSGWLEEARSSLRVNQNEKSRAGLKAGNSRV